MHIIKGWRGLDPDDRGASVALGAFDGVHRGHQKVIGAARDIARATSSMLGVISFEPHPWRWFRSEAPPFLLTTPAQQARRLEALGVERLYLLPFEEDLAAMPAEAFAEAVLAEGLGVQHVAIGSDTTFGKGRTGDGALLKVLGDQLGFGVSVLDPLTDDAGRKLSSTDVRRALEAGDPRTASEILGRPFAIEGTVVTGRKLGRTLGFPTANVALNDYVRPRLGIYATRTRLPDGRLLPGVASVGCNPTVGEVEPRLEVFLFDFDEDIYGQTIETELIDFLRPELKFDSIEALVTQMNADADAARGLLLLA